MIPRKVSIRAFSLIELLIVVGILSILTLIAIPNLKLAQIRSKVGRVKADLATLRTAMETYAVDYNRYPSRNLLDRNARFHCSGGWGTVAFYPGLTTPVAYLSTLYSLEDPFISSQERTTLDRVADKLGLPRSYFYCKSHEPNASGASYLLYSMGPAGKMMMMPGYGALTAYSGHVLLSLEPRKYFDAMSYDPSNGTVSRGYVLRYHQ